MRRKIKRYKLQIKLVQTLEIPIGAQVIGAGLDKNFPYITCIENADETRLFETTFMLVQLEDTYEDTETSSMRLIGSFTTTEGFSMFLFQKL